MRRIYRTPNVHDAVKLYAAVQLLAEISPEVRLHMRDWHSDLCFQLAHDILIPGARRIGARIERQRRRGDIDNVERSSYERLYKALVVRFSTSDMLFITFKRFVVRRICQRTLSAR